MGKKGKKAQAGKDKKLTFKDVGKKLDALVKKLEEELKNADLLRPLPPTEDCPICCIPLSRLSYNFQYYSCCGKRICTGCVAENEAHLARENEKRAAKDKSPLPDACPFCRAIPNYSDEQLKRQFEARAQKNKDVTACMCLAMEHLNGSNTYPKDDAKAIGYLIQAAEHGSADACHQMSLFYSKGDILPIDVFRQRLFEQVGALRGCI